MRCKPDGMLHHCQLDIETRLPCRVYCLFIPYAVYFCYIP
jgi:hypothetical protein